MDMQIKSMRTSRFARLTLALCALLLGAQVHAQTLLGDAPPDVPPGVPGNLLLALSVEYPTALSTANIGNFSPSSTYYGYFDPLKCYSYLYASSTTLTQYYVTPNTDLSNYFVPTGPISNGTCNGQWSGNFLNWATMQTIDPFRWALTGGYRLIDNTATTVLEKAWASGQGGSGETANRGLSGVAPNTVTPFNWSTLYVRIWGLGNRMQFSSSNNFDGINQSQNEIIYNPTVPVIAGLIYSLKVRVQVCAPGLLETNCTRYGSTYKPEGLIQQYSTRIRFGAMGYLNDSSILRDAGVLRAPIEFVGPLEPVANSTQTVTNPNAEWSGTTGIYVTDPDSTYSAATNANVCANSSGVTVPCVSQSGVVNYLNKFGYTSLTYKTYDPVSELYYASYRYFKNHVTSSSGVKTLLGNVPQWSDLSKSSGPQQTYTWIDGFPVITDWSTDPIQYACQKNFILGIGDVNTHASSNVPGPNTALPQTSAANEPTKPSALALDPVDSRAVTNMVGQLEGEGNLGTVNVPWCCGDDPSYYMAGLAYDAHVNDLRPNEFNSASNLFTTGTNIGKKTVIQTIDTYWLDVEEGQTYHYQNQFWLAAKYGGFVVPQRTSNSTFYTEGNPLPGQLSATSPYPDPSWTTGTNSPTLAVANSYTPKYTIATGVGDSSQPGGSGYAMPDHYFGAGNAGNMVKGLTNAFASIAAATTEVTTPFSTASPNLTSTGTASYQTTYSASTWTGDLIGYSATIDANDDLTLSQVWAVTGSNAGTGLLDVQAGNYTSGSSVLNGWNTRRFIATYNASLNQGVPFRLASIPTSLTASFASITGVAAVNQSAQNYLNYLRGDESNQSPSGAGYRVRTDLLGDIVDSHANAVAGPSDPYSETFNPGITAFMTNYANRKTAVYVGANDGMMHAFDGTLSSPPGGTELFAYVPSFLFNGPTNTPTVNGLASLGATPFAHHFMVDGTPDTFDIDLTRTGGVTSGSPNWRTLLIGGLGKGGMGYYALDVTDPGTLSNESALAGAVKWEFTDYRMGYSYGEPNVFKTKKYGWVVVFTSGYDNFDGHGYIFFVNPANGNLLETVVTPDTGTVANPAGLTQATAYITDFADGTAESLYATDLLGDVWRVDLTGTSGAYTAKQFAHATDGSGVSQPITTRPLIEIDPSTGNRYVLFGTGKYLDSSDGTSTQIQTFYAILDGNAAGFLTTLPSPLTFPITRSELAPLTASALVASGVTVGTGQDGWYFDLPTEANGVAYRVNINPAPDYGLVAFAANAPNGDACSPAGTNEVYTLSFATGQTALYDGNTALAYQVVGSGMITGLSFGQVSQGGGAAGKPVLIVGGSGSKNPQLIQPQVTGGGNVQRLNWREIPSSN